MVGSNQAGKWSAHQKGTKHSIIRFEFQSCKKDSGSGGRLPKTHQSIPFGEVELGRFRVQHQSCIDVVDTESGKVECVGLVGLVVELFTVTQCFDSSTTPAIDTVHPHATTMRHLPDIRARWSSVPDHACLWPIAFQIDARQAKE